jgi:hypothetical protein
MIIWQWKHLQTRDLNFKKIEYEKDKKKKRKTIYT